MISLLRLLLLSLFLSALSHTALCQNSVHIGNTLAVQKDALKTSMSRSLLMTEYTEEETSFYEPVLVSENETTAIVRFERVVKQNPLSGESNPFEKTTSYSKELMKAYDVKYRNVKGHFATNRLKLEQEWIHPDFETSTTKFGDKLALSFDGTKSRGLMELRSSKKSKSLYFGAEKHGNKISFFTFSPIRAYFWPETPQEILSDDASITLVAGNSTYKLSPELNYAITMHTQNRKSNKYITYYSDFSSTTPAGLRLPGTIKQEHWDSSGRLLASRVARFTSIYWGPFPAEFDESIFTIEFPDNTSYENYGLLKSALLRP